MSAWIRLLRVKTGAFVETRTTLDYRCPCTRTFRVKKAAGLMDHEAVEAALVHVETCSR